jgi:hypothetical protein
MTNVVVSYAPADAGRARAVADGLNQLGFNVVETHLDQPPPRTLPQIVLWSRACGAPPRLRRAPEALIVARLDAIEPPRFRGALNVNLQSWRGRPDHRGWRALIAALAVSSKAATATGEAFSSSPHPVAPLPAAALAETPDRRGTGWIIAGMALKLVALAGLGAAVWLALQQ